MNNRLYIIKLDRKSKYVLGYKIIHRGRLALEYKTPTTHSIALQIPIASLTTDVADVLLVNVITETELSYSEEAPHLVRHRRQDTDKLTDTIANEVSILLLCNN